MLDLRGNFGGVGGMSMGIAGHFVDSALTIGTMHQRGLTMKFVANPRRVDTQARAVTPCAGPLALVSQGRPRTPLSSSAVPGEPLADELYKIEQANSRLLKGKGSKLKRADVEKLRQAAR